MSKDCRANGKVENATEFELNFKRLKTRPQKRQKYLSSNEWQSKLLEEKIVNWNWIQLHVVSIKFLLNFCYFFVFILSKNEIKTVFNVSAKLSRLQLQLIISLT